MVDRKSDAVGKGRVIQAFGRKTGRRILGRPRSRWKGIIKMDL